MLQMRNVINISLPAPLTNVVDSEIKSGQFASRSEFIRHLLRLWSENKLYSELEQSRREIAQGKGKLLKTSLKELWHEAQKS